MQREVNQKLIKAYAILAIKYDGKVSVTALCEKAGVSRGTFYLYYKDIEEFGSAVMEYLVRLLLREGRILMSSSGEEMYRLSQRENLIFSEEELNLLEFYTEGYRYVDLGACAEKIIREAYEKDMCEMSTKDFYFKNKSALEFQLNGMVTMLVLDLIRLNNGYENRIAYDMEKCREYTGRLLSRIKAEDNT